MRQLIAVDWGTSSLRAALLDGRGQVLDQRSLPRGILTVPAGEFPGVLAAATAQWAQGATLYLLSGMAGSRQGWLEAPYCPCPAGLADVAARLAWVEPGRVAIVPGLSCEPGGVPDVMRGEETQIFGALKLLDRSDGVFVLPGTHSKWARVTAGRITSFSTFMTGEFYALLRQHSILSRTLPPAEGELDLVAFERGVGYAIQSGNLLHAAFSARTLSLFDRMPAQVLPSYLSGLVIGEELRSQEFAGDGAGLIVVGTDALTARYRLALQVLGIPAVVAGAEATWRGSWEIAQILEGIE